jgi:hypothetical protein
MHATCFSLDAKQEIIHTEGVKLDPPLIL